MSAALSIPPDILERAIAWAFQQSLERVDVESVTFLTVKEAAKLLKITPQCLRGLAVDQFDFKRGNTRLSLKDIRALVEKRRVKARS